MDAAGYCLDRSKSSSGLTVEGTKRTRMTILLNKIIVVPGECHWHLDLLCKQRSVPLREAISATYGRQALVYHPRFARSTINLLL